MNGTPGNPIAKYTQGVLSAEELATEDLESIKKIQSFIEEHPERIAPIVADVTYTKNLLNNLEAFLEENPSSQSTIKKIKNLVEDTLVKERLLGTFEKIENYRNLSPIHLKELILKKIDSMSIQEHRQGFFALQEIKDQKLQIEVLKALAAKDGRGVSTFIRNYGIRDQAYLVEIAKVAAAQSGEGVSEHIRNYGIADQSARIEIAKIAAAQNGWGLSWYIKNYDIRDQEALIAIAKIAITNNPWNLLQYLPAFFLDSRFSSNNEYKKLLLMDLAYLLPYMNSDFFEQFDELKVFASLIKEGSSQEEKESILKSKTPLGLFEERIEEFKKTFSDEKLQKNSPIEQALKYRSKQIAYLLIVMFIEEASDISYRKAYLTLVGETVTPRLPAILPAKWMKESGMTEAPNNLLKFFKEFKWALKNKDTGLMQMYLLTALSLDKLENIPPGKRLELLSSICSQKNAEDILKALSYLYYFSVIKEEGILNALIFEAPEDTNEVLSKAFEGMLSKDPFVDMSNVSDIRGFIDFYLELFGHMRIPLALEIYKAKIVTLNDERMKTEVKRFISSVLLKTFDEERFRTDINPHLAKIESNDSSVFNAWKTLEFSAPVSAISTGVEQTSFSFRGFFETKLGDGHWGKGEKDKLPHLTAYLQGGIIEEPNDPVLQSCKRLMETEGLSKEDQIKEIQKILSLLKDPKLRDLEFENDLEGLIRELNSKDQIGTNEEVVLSKDWQDLFLSGTEVAGSCQRVDGDPRATKCLLAYCMDGKNAMVAVKDKEGNKTLARSMLRLLWNENEQKPALFLDRLYPDPCLAERKQAIVEAATACAKQLNCDLFTKWEGYAEVPNTIVRSLGSSSPYEYADAAEGVMANGIFQIDNLKKVYPSTSMP